MEVAVVFSCRTMACAGNLDVIATVEAVFTVHFGKSGVQIPHVLLRLDFVLASENFL